LPVAGLSTPRISAWYGFHCQHVKQKIPGLSYPHGKPPSPII